MKCFCRLVKYAFGDSVLLRKFYIVKEAESNAPKLSGIIVFVKNKRTYYMHTSSWMFQSFSRRLMCTALSSRLSSLLRTIDKVRRSVFALVTAALISAAADYCRVVDSDTASWSISSPTAKRLFHRFIASPSLLQALQFRFRGGGEMQRSAWRQQVLDTAPRLNCRSNWMSSDLSPSICSAVNYKRRRL